MSARFPAPKPPLPRRERAEPEGESPRRSEGDSSVVPAQAEGNPDNTIVVPAEAGTQGGGGAVAPQPTPLTPSPAQPSFRRKACPVPDTGREPRGRGGNTAANPAHPEPNSTVIPAKAGTQGGGGGRSTAANSARTEPVLSTAEGSAHPEPNSSFAPAPTAVVPAKSLPRTRYGAGTHPRDPEPGSQLETKNSKLKTLPTRRTRTQRRRDGNARAATLRKGSERNKEEKDEKPAPAELTIAERNNEKALARAGSLWRTHRLHNPGRSPPR